MSKHDLIEECRARSAQGESIERLLEYLRSAGCSKVDSITVIMKARGIDLRKAKELVHFSSAWNDRRVVDNEFHDAISDELRNDADAKK